ncbi:hypothetical protein CVT24_001501 [Panaeolus cyanescens]|uniref:U3 small nucleolar RNA-associated protein 10 n=1 Tax=Panaeolus cyanescens TaxID=181874 RepID=A0A409YF78_9AGAR|nr:hypothetical protein CVT24_001501 [Panaeolus cyanescens]
MSSLAAQLAQNASLNAALLVDRSKRKPTVSYLFTGKDADVHDLESIHALAVNSFLHLASVCPELIKHEDALFSDRAKSTDRTLLTADALEELNSSLEDFMLLLGPYLMDPPATKIIEWLVRRFRIWEFNLDATLALFLPYHETPHFAKLVTILKIQPNSTWSFLQPYKSAAQNIPRVSLVTEMLKNNDLARFVANLLPRVLKKGLQPHHTLIAFNAATLHDFIKRSKKLNEGTVAYLLQALLEPLQQQKGKKREVSTEAILGSYILLVALSEKCELAPAALKVIIGAMTSCAEYVRGEQLVNSLLAVCEPQETLEKLSDGSVKALLSIPTLKDDLVSAASWMGIDKLLVPLTTGLVGRLSEESTVSLVEAIIATPAFPIGVIEHLTASLFKLAIDTDNEPQLILTSRRLLGLIQQRHPEVVSAISTVIAEEDEKMKEVVSQLSISLSMAEQVSSQVSSGSDQGVSAALSSTNPDCNVRVLAVKELLQAVKAKELKDVDNLDNIRGALIARLQDTEPSVLEVIYADADTILPVLASSPQAYLTSLSLALSSSSSSSKSKRALLRMHFTFLSVHFWGHEGATLEFREQAFWQLFFPFLLFTKPRQKTAEVVWDAVGKCLASGVGMESDASFTWLNGCLDSVNDAKSDERSLEQMQTVNFAVADKMAGTFLICSFDSAWINELLIADNILASNELWEHFERLTSRLDHENTYVKLLTHLVSLSLIKKLSGEHQIRSADAVLRAMRITDLSAMDDLSEVSEQSLRESLTKVLITKPNSKSALTSLQALIVEAIAQIPKLGATINSFTDVSESDTPEELYVVIMRTVYKIANSSTSLPVLSSSILQTLFTSLKDDALAFLAGIWSLTKSTELVGVRPISLFHAAAFLEAHILEADGVDFQTILPSLLIALQDGESRVCSGAMECISRIRIVSEGKLSSVYKFDAVYGSPGAGRELQYLGPDDLKKYLDALVEHRDHFINDSAYIKIFHAQHLSKVKGEKKKEADAGVADASSQSVARTTLSSILIDVSLIILLLDSLSPSGPTTSPRVKRVKTQEASEPENNDLSRLTLLAEVLGSKSLPGSLDLVSRLLETLNKVIQAFPSTQADVAYIEQLFMSAIESSTSKITEVPNISPSIIRLDVLVELIRTSGNPQTFQQALVLIASLARLAPDSVLFNVMPVFTFMGSNVFHRDDSYSFKVVQQTIDGIVPVMVSSLKKAHTNSLSLYIASKEFLRVFTDAATHIPRHRRNQFFTHLVDVLGPRDFAAAVCMLLVEKSANRVVRQSAEEAQNTLALPISILQHIDFGLQIYVANEVLDEASRIVAHILDPKSTETLFLERTLEGDHAASLSTILRRRAQSLISFVGFGCKAKSISTPLPGDASMSSVISRLITLAITPSGTTTDTKTEDVAEAARTSLNNIIGGMSVVDFMESVQTMLQSGDVKVQIGALGLVSKRLPEASVKSRPEITPSVKNILASIQGILNVTKDVQARLVVFQALKAIASSMAAGEEGPLSNLIPQVLASTKEAPTAAAALSAMSPMAVKLGPRIIPFFRAIITQCVTLLRSEESGLYGDAFAILHGLLTSIPTFWGSSEIGQIISLRMDQFSHTGNATSTALSSLIKAISKRIPGKVLLPTILDMWSATGSSANMLKIAAFFEVIARTLQHADRPSVLENLRTIFKVFLEALDIVKVDEMAEERVVSAFKEFVVKLNEAAFKPLFRRLYDWAFAGDKADNARKITFCHLYLGLLDYFKGLMVPYMSFLLQPSEDILKEYIISSSSEFPLWSSIIRVLSNSLIMDDAGFWRDDKLRQISAVLTKQVDVCVRLNFTDGRLQLQECFGALVETVTDDAILKAINLDILMHTRSEDARVRAFALGSSETLWRQHGGKLLAFVAETATFIAESGEDENDLVVKESFKLKDAVESVAGTIDGL